MRPPAPSIIGTRAARSQKIHHRIGHHISAPDRNQIVAVTVAPGVVARRHLRDRFKRGAVLEIGDVVMAGCQKDGLLDAVAAAHAHGRPVQPRGFAVADQQVLQDWLVDRSQEGLLLVNERDQRTEKVAVTDEIFRPVDRVQHPLKRSVRLVMAVLFPQNAVGGEAVDDQFAHSLLRLPVGHRHRRFVRLAVHCISPAKVAADNRPTLLSQKAREIKKVAMFRWGQNRFSHGRTPSVSV